MGTGSGGNRVAERVAPLGNSARVRPSAPVSGAQSSSYAQQFRASARRQKLREVKRRYEEVKKSKSVDVRADAKAKADAERAKVRAERQARR